MLPNLKSTLESAMRNKRTLLLRYKKQSRSRQVEPHLLYRSDRHGLILVGYQVKGYTTRGRTSPFWRPFQLAKIQSIYVVDEVFVPRTERGYTTVRDLIKGDIISQVDLQDSAYCHFQKSVCGPPIPNYVLNQSGVFEITGKRLVERIPA